MRCAVLEKLRLPEPISNFAAGELVPMPTACEASILIAVVGTAPVWKTSVPVVSLVTLNAVVDVVLALIVLI
jgi:hypothetical protein